MKTTEKAFEDFNTSIKKLQKVIEDSFNVKQVLCFFSGHKIVNKKCTICNCEFGIPKYPNPPNPPKKDNLC